MQALAQFRAMHERCQEEAPFAAEVVRFGIGYHELVLRWLEGLPNGDDDGGMR